MLRHYLTLAVKVLLRRTFFTFISLFAISFTLLVLTVATALLDHTFAPAPPETRQDLTLGVHTVMMYGESWSWNSSGGFRLFDRYARNLPGAERLSLYTRAQTAHSYVGGQKIASFLKRTDGEFWKILEFTFVEGAPYSNVDQARAVAVINRATRARFFGGEPALGKTIDVDGQRFRIVGVVDDVSAIRFVPFADMGAVHDGEIRFVQERPDGQLLGPRAGARHRRARADPRGIQLAARARRAARPGDLPGDRRAVRDQVRALRARRPVRQPEGPGPSGVETEALAERAGRPLHPPADGEPDQHQHEPHHWNALRKSASARRSGPRQGRWWDNSSSRTCC